MAPGAVLGVGTHAALQPPDWTADSFRVPALRLAGWQFTGGASG
jgi:hypothetical protein